MPTANQAVRKSNFHQQRVRIKQKNNASATFHTTKKRKCTGGHVPRTCTVIGQSLSGVNGPLITFECALSFIISLG